MSVDHCHQCFLLIFCTSYRQSPGMLQNQLLELMWGLWAEIPAYGRKGSQFVDLLGYFALKTPVGTEQEVCSILDMLGVK